MEVTNTARRQLRSLPIALTCEHVRSKALLAPPAFAPPQKPRGRPHEKSSIRLGIHVGISGEFYFCTSPLGKTHAPLTPAVVLERKGFGSKLIRMGLVGTGGVDASYIQSGIEAELHAPIAQVQMS